jgi:hypothetical protein
MDCASQRERRPSGKMKCARTAVTDMPCRDREGSSPAIEKEDRALPGQERRLNNLRLIAPQHPGHMLSAAVVHPPREFLHLWRLLLGLA